MANMNNAAWYEEDRKEEDYGLLRGFTHVEIKKKETYVPKEKVTSEPVTFHGTKKIHKLLVR